MTPLRHSDLPGLRAAACGLLLALTLGGCGGGGGPSAAPAAAAAAPADTTATDATTTDSVATETTATTPDPVATSLTGVKALSVTAASWLDLDLLQLANYASPTLPAHYDARASGMDSTPVADPVSNRLATLGRVLFNDRRLSVNDTVSCASCHQQAVGFDDPARLSAGVSGTQFTSAHAMRLGNVRYWRPGTMFWDRRAASLETQATQPIQHPVEMGFDAAAGGLAALVAKMNALPYYPELFEFAFGDAAITEARIQRALAHFERAMVSAGSAWDTAYALNYDPALADRGLSLPARGFSAEQERGRVLFINGPQQGGLGCAGCHVPPTFALDRNSRSNGLDAGETVIFKSPSLKNVALGTAFMHDGRFSSLAQVVDHYDAGVQAGPALDNRLRQGNGGPPRRLNLSVADKQALVAFMGTLTDTAFTADPKFGSPFRR
ncbi:MAG: cytochrome-c peroxidase [Burkholderiales bacterium]|nr:MAG: cytochrome-c peroxidase [Burkholderiales bacterium]